MYVCPWCERVYDGSELNTHRECHGETSLGDRLEETFVDLVCPECGTELEKAQKCHICGEHFYDEKSVGVCPECVEAYSTVRLALKSGARWTETAEINAFALQVLGERKINEILERWISENVTDGSKEVIDFLSEDGEDWARLVHEEKNNG
jgi:hypothetical protein